MSNMSYCRFHNTNLDLQDCNYALEEALNENQGMALSDMELRAARQMYEQCQAYMELYEQVEEQELFGETEQTEEEEY